jgi:hypothetical protein
MLAASSPQNDGTQEPIHETTKARMPAATEETAVR